jgi:uncharacterized damage-inducible protein DinB
MTIAQSLLPEIDQENASTRRLLELVPDSRAAWKPHAKSWSLGDLSVHIANLPAWAAMTMQSSELDLRPPGGPAWTPPKYSSPAATVEMFDENSGRARAAIAAASDADLMAPWTLKKAGQTIFTLPRVGSLRSFVMNHVIHHRGQLTVYLRLCDVPLPSTYGPTADASF